MMLGSDLAYLHAHLPPAETDGSQSPTRATVPPKPALQASILRDRLEALPGVRYSNSVPIEPLTDNSADIEEMAAVKMQSASRGRMTRRRVQGEAAAATTLQRVARGQGSRRDAKRLREDRKLLAKGEIELLIAAPAVAPAAAPEAAVPEASTAENATAAAETMQAAPLPAAGGMAVAQVTSAPPLHDGDEPTLVALCEMWLDASSVQLLAFGA